MIDRNKLSQVFWGDICRNNNNILFFTKVAKVGKLNYVSFGILKILYFATFLGILCILKYFEMCFHFFTTHCTSQGCEYFPRARDLFCDSRTGEGAWRIKWWPGRKRRQPWESYRHPQPPRPKIPRKWTPLMTPDRRFDPWRRIRVRLSGICSAPRMLWTTSGIVRTANSWLLPRLPLAMRLLMWSKCWSACVNSWTASSWWDCSEW